MDVWTANGLQYYQYRLEQAQRTIAKAQREAEGWQRLADAELAKVTQTYSHPGHAE